MMRAFVTGGTGFIGRRVVQKLVAAGWQVRGLARSAQNGQVLRKLGAQPVEGDITRLDSLPAAMAGCDVVFHLAAWYKMGVKDQSQAEPVNVAGTRNVLETAWKLGIPKIIYTSSIAVLGDTKGQQADENYRMPAGIRFRTEYDRTKHLAHYQVALPLMEQGAPVVTLMPGAVYGYGDHSLVGQLMRAFYAGLLPVFPGPDTYLSMCYLDEAAELHLAAVDRARTGECYLLGGPTISLGEAVRMWAAVTGRAKPLVFVPARVIHWLEPFSRLLAMLWPNMPALLSVDGIHVLGTAYAASSAKAERELGWSTRPYEQGFRETFKRMAEGRKPAQSEPLRSRKTML